MAVGIASIDPVRDKKNGQAGQGGSGSAGIHEIKREALNHPMLQKVLDVFSSAEVREVIARKNQEE